MYACLFCLLPPDVFRQSWTQHSLSRLCASARMHAHTRTHTHTHTHTHTRSSALIWCDRAVILAVLTLWASICLPLSPSYHFGSRSQSGVHQPLPPATSVCLHVCVCLCSPFYRAVSARVRSESQTKDKAPSLICSKISWKHTRIWALQQFPAWTTHANPLFTKLHSLDMFFYATIFLLKLSSSPNF